jgi:hypothetical protein
MAQTMLRIAADIDHLDDLTEHNPSARLASNPDLVRKADMLRAQVNQAAYLSRCPVLHTLVEEDQRQRSSQGR